MKATHEGSCQCCGRLQKLPNGLLSKHGYTVDFGYFSGVCRGAEFQPFEVSCDQVQRYIREAQDVLRDMNETIAATYANVSTAWVYEYVKGDGRYTRGEYKWRNVEVVEVEHKYEATTWKDFETGETRGYPAGSYLKFHYVGLDGKNHEMSVDASEKDIKNVCRSHNETYVKMALLPRFINVIKYVKWQTKRVQEWKPGTLKEVK